MVGFSTYGNGAGVSASATGELSASGDSSGTRNGLLGESRSGKSLFLTERPPLGVRGKRGGVTGSGATGAGCLREGGGEMRPVRFRRRRWAGGDEEGERVGERESERPRVGPGARA